MRITLIPTQGIYFSELKPEETKNQVKQRIMCVLPIAIASVKKNKWSKKYICDDFKSYKAIMQSGP